MKKSFILILILSLASIGWCAGYGGGGATAAQLALKLDASEVEQTVSVDADKVPSSAAVQSALYRPIDGKVAFFGDSGTAINSGTLYGYPSNTWTEIFGRTIPTLETTNMAVGGSMASNQLVKLQASSLAFDSNKVNAAFIMIGGNGITSSVAAVAETTNYIALIREVQSRGCTNIALMSYYGFGALTSYINTLNVLMKDFAYSNNLAWVDSAKALHYPGTLTVQTNYLVGVIGTNAFNYHINAAGNRVIASLASKAFVGGLSPLQSQLPLDVPSRTVTIGAPIYLSSGCEWVYPPNSIGAGANGVMTRHAISSAHRFLVPPYGATNLTFKVLFGSDAATNTGIRLFVNLSTYTNDATGSTAVLLNDNGIVATNGYTGTGTNNQFTINVPIPSAYWYTANQIKVYTLTPTTNGATVFCTNYWGAVTAQVLPGY